MVAGGWGWDRACSLCHLTEQHCVTSVLGCCEGLGCLSPLGYHPGDTRGRFLAGEGCTLGLCPCSSPLPLGKDGSRELCVRCSVTTELSRLSGVLEALQPRRLHCGPAATHRRLPAAAPCCWAGARAAVSEQSPALWGAGAGGVLRDGGCCGTPSSTRLTSSTQIKVTLLRESSRGRWCLAPHAMGGGKWLLCPSPEGFALGMPLFPPLCWPLPACRRSGSVPVLPMELSLETSDQCPPPPPAYGGFLLPHPTGPRGAGFPPKTLCGTWCP